MPWFRVLAPAVVAGCAAIVSLSAAAQTASAVEKPQKVDARAMVPAPQASDAMADSQPAGGLTRDQRKEATLQARQQGALQPAGEAAADGAQPTRVVPSDSPSLAKKGARKKSPAAAASTPPA